MSDEEKLLAEALRAKAGHGGVAPGGTEDTTPTHTGQPEREPASRASVLWIVALAVALGLATGAVIGLLTVL